MKSKTFNEVSVKNYVDVFNEIEVRLLEHPKKTCTIKMIDSKSQRSIAISNHFHAHVTYIARILKESGLQVSRNKVYFECLLLACEMETVEGAKEYPYEIINRNILGHGEVPVLEPLRTTNRSNKEMMQAVEAAHRYASMVVLEIYHMKGIELPESEEWGSYE